MGSRAEHPWRNTWFRRVEKALTALRRASVENLLNGWLSRGPSSSWRPSWQPSSSSSPWKWLLTMSTHAWFSHPLPRMLWEGSGRRFDAVLTVIAHHQPHIDKELWMMMGKTVKRTSGKNPEIFPSLIATRAALIVVEFARDLVVTPRRCRRRAFASPIPSASTPAERTTAQPRRRGS